MPGGHFSEDHRLEAVGSADDILHDLDLLLRVNLIHEHIHYHGQRNTAIFILIT